MHRCAPPNLVCAAFFSHNHARCTRQFVASLLTQCGPVPECTYKLGRWCCLQLPTAWPNVHDSMRIWSALAHHRNLCAPLFALAITSVALSILWRLLLRSAGRRSVQSLWGTRLCTHLYSYTYIHDIPWTYSSTRSTRVHVDVYCNIAIHC